MFGKRQANAAALDKPAPTQEAKTPKPEPKAPATPQAPSGSGAKSDASEEYYETKATIFNALFETIDVSALAGMQPDKARDEIRAIVDEIIAIRNVRLSVSEQNQLITEICDDILGYGPLEPLLLRDDIADIMVKHPEAFTAAELIKINEFYSTDAGQKAIEKMPELMTKGGMIGASRVQENLGELQDMIKAEAERLQAQK